MKTVLVTGGCGFIGSHTCVSLIENDYKVVVIDSFTNSSPTNFNILSEIVNIKYGDLSKRFFLFKGDIRDEFFLSEIFKEFQRTQDGIDSVIHIAGLKAVSESILKPLEYWSANVGGTISLLKITRKSKTIEGIILKYRV